MKILFTTLFFSFFLIISANAQVIVNGININEIESLHILRIFIVNNIGYTKNPKVAVDYGQGQDNVRYRKAIIENKSGKVLEVKTIINAINFFENNGWQMTEIETVTSGGEDGIDSKTYYYFRRK